MGAAQTSRIFRSAKRLKKDEHKPSIWLFKCNSLFNIITTFVYLIKKHLRHKKRAQALCVK